MAVKRWNGGTVRLRWQRSTGGYMFRLHQAGESTEADDETIFSLDVDRKRIVVCPKGTAFETFDVAVGDCRIFADLLQMEEGDAGILSFASKWGLLHGPTLTLRHSFAVLRRQFAHIYRNRFTVSQAANYFYRRFGEPHSVATVRVMFDRVGKRDPIEMLWYADRLSEFMVLEVLADLGGGSSVSTCSTCGKFFTRSAVKGPAPEHCSNACKQKAYRWRKASV